MQLSKQQVNTILQNAPMGSDKNRIVEGLISRGYQLEGLDNDVALQNINLKKQGQRVQTELVDNQFDREDPNKSFLAKTRDFAGSVIGGDKVAEGLGKGLAAGGVREDIAGAQAQTSDLKLKLVKRINEKKALGEDTSRLDIALAGLDDTEALLSDTQSDFTESLPSNKEVIGSAARLAGNIVAPTLIGKATKGIQAGTGIAGGALQGAKVGAIGGAIEGGIQGGGLALENEGDLGDVAKGVFSGTLFGTLLGGAGGAVFGGVSGGVKASKIKKAEFAENFAAPKETAKVKAEALRQGRLEDKGFFKKSELARSTRDKKIGAAINDAVSPKASLGENIDGIRRKLNTTNAGVEDFISKNKSPFNGKQLRSKLTTGKKDLDLIFASDKSAEKTYDAVVEAFMKEVKNKDTLGVFKARQSFDKIPAVKKLLDSDVLGENARREIVLAVRGSANDYVSTLLPKGNQFKATLLQEHYMLEALDNIAKSNANVVGKNGLQLLTEEYPVLKWLAAGLAGAGGVGIGGAIIGSTD